MTLLKKSILITGISGAGKSTVSAKLNEAGYKAYDMDKEPELFTMISIQTQKPVVDHDNANLEKVMGMEWICDKNKLINIIENESSPLAFYCGGASNMEDLLPLFDKIILLMPGESAARERLTSRINNSFGRTKEVQDWIMSKKDSWESKMKDKGATLVNAEKSIDEVIKEIVNIII